MAREQTPSTLEGALLRRARQRLRPKVAMADAAQQAGITADYWGHIERGYQSMGKDQPPREVIAPASTLAHMAKAIRITPEELAATGREDAAEFLRDLLRQDQGDAQRAWVPQEVRQAVFELKEKARDEQRSLAQVLIETGLAAPDDLILPNAMPPDPIIAEIEASTDLSEDTKRELIKLHLKSRAQIFEEERLNRKKRDT